MPQRNNVRLWSAGGWGAWEVAARVDEINFAAPFAAAAISCRYRLLAETDHFAAASLPTFEDAGVRARVIAGSAFGTKSPMGMLSEWLYAEVSLPRGEPAA